MYKSFGGFARKARQHARSSPTDSHWGHAAQGDPNTGCHQMLEVPEPLRLALGMDKARR